MNTLHPIILNTVQPFMLFLASFFIALCVFTLVSAWFAPKLLSTSFMTRMTTGRRLAPSRANRTLTAIYGILIGIFVILVFQGHMVLGLIALAAWLPFGLVVTKRTFWPSTEV